MMSIEGPPFGDDFNCSKPATKQRKCPNFTCRQNAVQKGQMDSGKLVAKLCQDRVSKSFIIPASQKVSQIF
ncbi:rCG58244 [Rattus norvegicus]|uniref:RCG58244 n=1 Tax=Rattus norvegicus TaxID=10116 RepID=A6J3U8_RAT|nr:rCG58244 [Rattus norvegicus]